MKFSPIRLSLVLLLAFGVATGAAAQSTNSGDTAFLPVWNNASGKVEAILVLEPAENSVKSGVRTRFGSNSLDAVYGLEAGDSLALLCDRKNGLSGAIGNLANHCMLAALGQEANGVAGSQRNSVTTAFNTDAGRLGITVGKGSDTLPGWLTPGARSAGSKVDINDLTVFAQKNLSLDGYVSIAGTVAKARLASPSEFPDLADRWSSKSLTIGGGFGAFGASIVGHVTDTPGQPKFEGLGLGLTWRTPWSGQLTVGAENVVTRGKNPFSPANGDTGDEEDAVPYVRYEQDL